MARITVANRVGGIDKITKIIVRCVLPKCIHKGQRTNEGFNTMGKCGRLMKERKRDCDKYRSGCIVEKKREITDLQQKV